jgi:hypothetical protein
LTSRDNQHQAKGNPQGADRPLVLFIVYQTAEDALARGYEGWLRDVDNPFFNTIPGIKRYENWKLEGDVADSSFSHFDFLWLERAQDLERVWFNSDLDEFRRGWVAKWGYGPAPKDVHKYTYGMTPVKTDAACRAPQAWLYGGVGLVPDALGTVFEVTMSLAKHFANTDGGRADDWCLPATSRNPLECNWVGLSTERVVGLKASNLKFAYPVSVIAAPD